LAETDGSGNITSYYVYGLGLISKITPGGQVYYYQYDDLGSTIAITDSSGNVVNQYAYDPFGNLANSTETVPNPFRYVGALGVMDEGNGLLYMRARYYAPNIGRFINQDPIGLAGGLNMYAYVGNNPVSWVDPSGNFVVPAWIIWTMISSAVIGQFEWAMFAKWEIQGREIVTKYPDPAQKGGWIVMRGRVSAPEGYEGPPGTEDWSKKAVTCPLPRVTGRMPAGR
jgi:RHS repeat-associated protein